MLGMILLRMPIAFALLVSGFIGIVALRGIDIGLTSLYLVTFQTVTSPGLTVLPFFILVGSLVAEGRMGQTTFSVLYRWVGRLPGGLSIATFSTSALFAACCGSSPAAAATLGKISIPEMNKYGYSKILSTGTCAAGGLLAALIPPSAAIVLYGIVSGESISHVLIAGIIPGLLLATLFSFTSMFICIAKPDMGPRGESFTWREKIAVLPQLWAILLVMFSITGGIFFGIFSPNEAGAVGCLIAMLALFIQESIKEGRRRFFAALRSCGAITAMLFFIIIGASLFSSLVLQSGVGNVLISAIKGMGINRYAIVLAIVFLYLPLGMFMDSASMLLITIPIFHPVVTGLGFEGIWYGIIVVMMMEIGMITPPIGINCFVMSGVVPDVPLTDVFKGALIFGAVELLLVFALIAFPEIALWLPTKIQTF
jgi:tripartite ATP-independent transporter DctM subunit